MLLIVSEFLDLFQVRTSMAVIDTQTGGGQHSYALLVVGAVAILVTLLARSSEAWPVAAAVVALGLLTLGIALIGDLPDVTSSGLTEAFENASARPAAGFWVELAGAVALVGGGAVLTYVLRERGARRGERG